MRIWLKSLLIFALIFSATCSKKKPARIVNRGHVVYGKNGKISKTKKAHEFKQVEIEKGDTLHSVAKKNQISVRELVNENRLDPPYEIKVGEHLNIPASNYHQVKSGDTLYSISRLYGMKIDQLVELNNLKQPYSVRVGDSLKISKIVEKKIERKPEQLAQKPGFIEKTLDRMNHFSWPVRGKVVSQFGPKSGGLYNDGINIKAKEGENVKAAEDGVVAYVGNELKGYGNLVIIKHSSGWITAYAHLKEWSVARGQKIAKGQKVGLVGMSGNVESPQLYFGLRKGRDAVNPESYLR